MLTLPNGTPISRVVETYTSEVFPSPAARRALARTRRHVGFLGLREEHRCCAQPSGQWCGRRGLEPSRGHPLRILSPVCLPVPPRPRRRTLWRVIGGSATTARLSTGMDGQLRRSRPPRRSNGNRGSFSGTAISSWRRCLRRGRAEHTRAPFSSAPTVHRVCRPRSYGDIADRTRPACPKRFPRNRETACAERTSRPMRRLR